MALKTVLITGCSSGGIGHGLALEFARRGFHVFATARSQSKMADLKELPNVTLLALDVISYSSIAEAVAGVKRQTGGTLDYLVNNSGAQYVMPMLDVDISKSNETHIIHRRSEQPGNRQGQGHVRCQPVGSCFGDASLRSTPHCCKGDDREYIIDHGIASHAIHGPVFCFCKWKCDDRSTRPI